MAEDGFITKSLAEKISNNSITVDEFFESARQYFEENMPSGDKDQIDKKRIRINSVKRIRDQIANAGFDTNSRFYDFATKENIKKLMEHPATNVSTFTTEGLMGLEDAVASFYSDNKLEKHLPYPFAHGSGKRITGGGGSTGAPKGLARSWNLQDFPEGSSAIAKYKDLKSGKMVTKTIAFQTRRSKAFRRIPKPKVTIEAVVKAIGNIDGPGADAEYGAKLAKLKQKKGEALEAFDIRKAELKEGIFETRRRIKTAITFNVLVPYRPGEVAKLTLSEINTATGEIESRVVGNKVRNALTIPDVALEILRDAEEEALKRVEVKLTEMQLHPSTTAPEVIEKARQELLSKETVFGIEQKQMSKVIMEKGGLKDLLEKHQKTLGRSIAGSKDIRKLMPSLLAHHLGASKGVVSALLGHASTADATELLGSLHDMSSTFYISPVDVPGEVSAETRALRALQAMIAENVDAASLNELPDVFGVSAKNLTADDADILELPDRHIDAVHPVPVEQVDPDVLESRKVRRQLALASLRERLQLKFKDVAVAALESLGLRKKVAKEEPDVVRSEIASKHEVERLLETEEAYKQHEGLTADQLETDADLKDIDDTIPEEYRYNSEDTPEQRKTKKLNLSRWARGLRGAVGVAAPYLLKGLVTPLALIPDIAEASLTPSHMGGTPEDMSDEALLEALQTGKALPGSGDITLGADTRKSIEREARDRERSARHSAMMDEASQYELMSGAPPPEHIEQLGQQMTKGFVQAEKKYEESPLHMKYKAYFEGRDKDRESGQGLVVDVPVAKDWSRILTPEEELIEQQSFVSRK
jgi:integrase